jgi:hypothetical protein
MHINPASSCAALTKVMGASFAAQKERPQSLKAAAAVQESFRDLIRDDEAHNAKLGFVAIHDDCVARLFHSIPASAHVDLSLCEMASDQSAQLVFAAVHGTVDTARLAAGPLAARLASQLRHLADDTTASADAEIVRLVLLSAHDTTIMNTLSMLDHCGASAPALERFGHHWPPHCSSICFEIVDPNPPGPSTCSRY